MRKMAFVLFSVLALTLIGGNAMAVSAGWTGWIDVNVGPFAPSCYLFTSELGGTRTVCTGEGAGRCCMKIKMDGTRWTPPDTCEKHSEVVSTQGACGGLDPADVTWTVEW